MPSLPRSECTIFRIFFMFPVHLKGSNIRMPERPEGVAPQYVFHADLLTSALPAAF